MAARGEFDSADIGFGHEELQPGAEPDPRVHARGPRDDEMPQLVGEYERPPRDGGQHQDQAAVRTPQQIPGARQQFRPRDQNRDRRQHQAAEQHRQCGTQREPEMFGAHARECRGQRPLARHGTAVDLGHEAQRHQILGEGSDVEGAVHSLRGLLDGESLPEEIECGDTRVGQRDEPPGVEPADQPFAVVRPLRQVVQANPARGLKPWHRRDPRRHRRSGSPVAADSVR